LREAIRQANSRPGTVIRFPKDQRLIIYPTTPLPPITANGTVFDGPSGTVLVRAFPPTFPPSNATYTGPLAWILGDKAGTTASGLVVQASNCTLRGIHVSGFALNQIAITGSGNTVRGCDVAPAETAASPAKAGGSGGLRAVEAGGKR